MQKKQTRVAKAERPFKSDSRFLNEEHLCLIHLFTARKCVFLGRFFIYYFSFSKRRGGLSSLEDLYIIIQKIGL